MLRSRLLPHPFLSAVLLAVWLLAFNSIAPGVLLLGIVLAVVLPMVTAPFWPESPRVKVGLAIPKLAAVVLWDIVVANVRVAILILGPMRRLHPRFLEVPLEVRSPSAITTLAGIITLTPGTVSANLSGDRRTLLVHALSARDPEAAIAAIKQRYERPLLEIFEC
jgi:multicomponent K+:H+ antiporter subunit E